MPVAVVTRTVIARPRFIPRFAWGSLVCAIQAQRTPGYLNGTMAISPRGLVFWTLTVWQDGQSMMGFRNSGRHAKFMPRLAGWAREAAFAGWKVADARLPAWDEVQAVLETRGSFPPLDHPDRVHQTKVVPPRERLMLAVPFLRRRAVVCPD